MFFYRNKGRSSIKEIIIHAGLHKTATTSIQETFFTNAERLKERGFLYPACWPSNHSIPIYGAFTSNKAFFENIVEGQSSRRIRNNNKRFLKVFEEEVARAEQRKIVISAENISLLSLEELTNFQQFLRKTAGDSAAIKVFISVRHPVPWLVSAAQENLKAGKDIQFVLDEKMNLIIQNLFRTRVGNLLQTFGRDSVEVYRFEDSVKHEFGPVGCFLERLGFEDEEIKKFHIIKANESISLIAADLLAFINEKCPIIMNDRLSERRTREDINPLLAIRGPKFDIPSAYKKVFFEKAQEDLKWLRETCKIDYSNELLSEPDDPQLVFCPETIDDINHAYDNLTPTLKKLMVEYLGAKLKDKTSKFMGEWLR